MESQAPTRRNWRIPKSFRIGLWLIGVPAVVLVPLAVAQWMTLGWVIPKSKVDKLTNPVQVVGWNVHGLELSDGRSVMPAGMKLLPKSSPTIAIATAHGVEVDSDGKTYGLVKLWHWCGNDAVRYDLHKVDLAKLLCFYREGESILKPGTYSKSSFVEMGGGSSRGWSISGFGEMNMAFDPKFAFMFEPEGTSKKAPPRHTLK